MNTIKKVLTVFMAVFFSLSVFSSVISAEGYSSYQERSDQGQSYMVKQRPVFNAETNISGPSLKITEFAAPKDICIQGDKVYILDSGNSRIVVLNSDYTFNSIIDAIVYNGEKIELSDANGIFVSKDKTFYIADPVSECVFVIDNKGVVKRVIKKPESPIIPESLEFKATKVLVDIDGYIFVLCEGVYYGAMVFDENYNFCGFFGANQTSSNLLDTIKYFFTKIFQTDIKKQYSLRTLPYELSDLCEYNGFIYTATKNSKDGKGQIRKLSSSGINTLNHNGESGDLYTFGNGKKITLVDKTIVDERFCSVSVDSNGYIYALDSSYGRVFVYDTECNLITAFGGGLGLGEQLGSFTSASEVAVNGTDVLVVDSALNNITVFRLTDFGKLLFSAISTEDSGEYEKAFPLWKKVLSSDAFNQRAYTGLANYYFAKGDFDKALDYSEKALNRDLYDQSFEEVRREALSKGFIWIFVAIFIIIGLIILVAILKKKNKLPTWNNNNSYLKNTILSIRHPIQTSNYIKRLRLDKKKKDMNIYTVISLALFFLTFVFKVLETTAGGFLYADFDPNVYSSALVFLSTFGILVMWCIVNWGLCTLFEGKGTFREIVIVTGFAMIPQILNSIFFIIASHFLLYSESAIISGVGTVAWIATIVILLVELSVIHDYSFFRAIGMSIATIIGMCVAAFMILLVLTLFQDLIEFVRSIYSEIIYRGI